MRRFALLFLLGLFPGCPGPPPGPTPSPSPTHTPTPTPEACTCSAPGSKAPGWSGTTVDVPYAAAFIVKARTAVGNRCGTDGNETLALVAEAMKVQNICAVGPWADAMLVARPDGVWEEWHVIEWSNTKVALPSQTKVPLEAGCWYPLSKAFKGAWMNLLAQAPKKGCR